MEEELGLSLGDMVKAIKRRWYLLVIIPIIVAVLANFYVANYTVDVYTAQVKLYTLFDYVDTTGTTRYDLSSSAYFVNDYKELIQAPEVMRETCSRLGWPGWPGGMSVGVSAVQDTRFITISVTGLNPEMCMQAANMLGQVFSEYIRNMLNQDSVHVAVEATLPTWPSNGGRGSMVPMAALASLALVAFALVALEILNTKVRADSDADVRFKTNILSSVFSYKKEMDVFLKKHMSRESNILACMNEYTQESIKKLALNIQFAAMGEPLRTLTVTSTTPKEGKSSVSLMLACELASQGKNVLIADMDYRSPMIGRYLGRRNKKDIMDYLNGSAKLTEVVTRTSTPNLFFMDSNHRMAVNANLDSFGRFLEECKQYFDLVIFDTSPLGMFIDAASLAAKTDGTIVVVADGRVERKDLTKVLGQLEQVKARLLGLVFNFVNHKEKSYYYNRYYRYGDQHKSERRRTRGLSNRRAQEEDEE
ncbi:MAG: polysaccharide biosynthesis tyrosine autokinase [Clostridia bacterium]|nr:polysaccharide biosynthesis tyrosine autokinase [Clostridia bacterium]